MTSEIVLKIKFKNAHGLIKLHTLQIKYYNELHWSQKSEWDMDKVTVFYVGDLFCIHLGTKYVNLQEENIRGDFWKKCLNFSL